MQRHLGIRGKVLAVLVLPALVLAGASGVVSMSARAQVQRAQQVRTVSASSERLGAFVDALQTERLASAQAVSGDVAARAGLVKHRVATDATRLAVLRELVGWSFGAPELRIREGADAVIAGADRLPTVREQVDDALAATGGTDSDLDAFTRGYGEIVDVVVDLPLTVAGALDDRRTATGLEAASWLGRAGEALSREQLAGVRFLGTETAGAGSRSGAVLPAGEMSAVAEVAATDELRLVALARFQAVADSGQRAVLRQAQSVPHGTTPTVDVLAARLLGRSPGGPASVDLQTWQQVTALRAAALRQASGQVTAGIEVLSAQAVDEARLRVELTLAGAVLLVGLSVLLALIQSRRITAPLRRLTAVATGLAADLPDLVAQAQAGSAVPDEPVTVVPGRDEVGRLAEAFGAVHATTLVVVREQVALRATVSEMFVNVARRNQALLSRLLAFIDRLERREEDPDVLDNLFRLDHLATRMRRNAESLLVLAGADSGRRLRAPMPLADVLRTAVSEVEHFDRVQFDLPMDPLIVGHLALPAAHLLAELIENATNFSDPGSPVWVTGNPEGGGLRLTIRDQGMGLPPEDLSRVNVRLAEPGTVDTMNSQRLGFFVVGRLAARLDSRVRLEPGGQGGIQAVVEFSPALFVPGSLSPQPEPVAPAGLPGLVLVEDAGVSEAVATEAVPAGNDGAVAGTERGRGQPGAHDAPSVDEAVPAAAVTVVTDDGSEPFPNWQVLLHQRHTGIPHGSIADPLFSPGWLTPDAWADAPSPFPPEETAEIEEAAELELPPGRSTRSVESSTVASPLWKPEETPTQASITPVSGSTTPDSLLTGDGVGGAPGTEVAGGLSGPTDPVATPPRLPRRTPALPSIPGADRSAVLPRRTPSNLPGAAGLPPELDLGSLIPPPTAAGGSVPPGAAPVAPISPNAPFPTRSSGSAGVPGPEGPAPVDPGGSGGAGSVPGVYRAAASRGGTMRNILPHHGLRLGLRLGRRSRARTGTGDPGGQLRGRSVLGGSAPASSRSAPAGSPAGGSVPAGADVLGSGRELTDAGRVVPGSVSPGVASPGVASPRSGSTPGGVTGEHGQVLGGRASGIAGTPGTVRRATAGSGPEQAAAHGTVASVSAPAGRSEHLSPAAGGAGVPASGFGQGERSAAPTEGRQFGDPLPATGFTLSSTTAAGLGGVSQPGTSRPWAMAGVDPADEERLRHAIASEALSELSQLSSYRPDKVSPAPSSRLVRRTPVPASGAVSLPAPGAVPTAGAVDTGTVPGAPVGAVPAETATTAHSRDADQLRRMLSGFQTGVRRGRGVPDGGKSIIPGGDEWRVP